MPPWLEVRLARTPALNDMNDMAFMSSTVIVGCAVAGNCQGQEPHKASHSGAESDLICEDPIFASYSTNVASCQ
jgi:hypothetical protein